MENQHRKINGYRELSQEEIDLMNRIKTKGTELAGRLVDDQSVKARDSVKGQEQETEYKRFCAAEPLRWAAIGKTDIQTGIMALVRAVAQPRD